MLINIREPHDLRNLLRGSQQWFWTFSLGMHHLQKLMKAHETLPRKNTHTHFQTNSILPNIRGLCRLLEVHPWTWDSVLMFYDISNPTDVLHGTFHLSLTEDPENRNFFVFDVHLFILNLFCLTNGDVKRWSQSSKLCSKRDSQGQVSQVVSMHGRLGRRASCCH